MLLKKPRETLSCQESRKFEPTTQATAAVLTEGRFLAQEDSLYARPDDEIDFAEKILVLLYDPVFREKMGGHGRLRVVEELQWEHEKPKLLQAYEVLFAS